MSVPKLVVSQQKLDQLAEDLKKLEINTVIHMGGGSVPAFQRQGYLEKLGHSRMKWFRRFFVLRDSFLLSYNLQKSDFTVEPRAAVHLGNAVIQLLDHPERQFCFLITTMQKDRFLFAAENEDERRAWVKDLEEAKLVTHANMIKLSVENKCLAEEKGAAAVAIDNSTSALSIFSNPEYIQSTPITGGAEGWLRTTGFNADEQSKSAFKLGKAKSSLTKCYFILRDSHLLMFHGGDILTKPRGAMYLIGTAVTAEEEITEEKSYYFTVKSQECGDEIGLVASTAKVRSRWMQALKIGSRVSHPDYKLLMKEHELLAAVTMTPRAAPPQKPNAPSEKIDAPPPPLLTEEFDIQGQQLDPGTRQAFDDSGNPILRGPDGQLVNVSGEVVTPTVPRYGLEGEQLDAFNRPLPPGAVPMFTAAGVPIGVGPDGAHYLPDGTIVLQHDPHFDASGNQLSQETVDASNAVATNVSVAIRVRAKLKGDNAQGEAVDVLGRTFRGVEAGGKLINADGQEVPMASARLVDNASGKLVQYTEPKKESNETHSLLIKVENEGEEEHELGSVEINETTNLKDVRERVTSDLKADFPDFVFLFNGVSMLKHEEANKLAINCLPEIVIRGKELKAMEPPKSKFNKKLSELQQYQDKKRREEEEFAEVMARVRQGKFLKSAN
eukprot:c20934_g1_i2.p1 GENE.c20934_g1_i2~~c20934_g1_i2.p1  ORF type:complete len:667 (-),score=274.74 c20934_g1_i2:617-2617(-)